MFVCTVWKNTPGSETTVTPYNRHCGMDRHCRMDRRNVGWIDTVGWIGETCWVKGPCPKCDVKYRQAQVVLSTADLVPTVSHPIIVYQTKNHSTHQKPKKRRRTPCVRGRGCGAHGLPLMRPHVGCERHRVTWYGMVRYGMIEGTVSPAALVVYAYAHALHRMSTEGYYCWVNVCNHTLPHRAM